MKTLATLFADIRSSELAWLTLEEYAKELAKQGDPNAAWYLENWIIVQ